MHCQKCGTENLATAKFCKSCGEESSQNQYQGVEDGSTPSNSLKIKGWHRTIVFFGAGMFLVVAGIVAGMIIAEKWPTNPFHHPIAIPMQPLVSEPEQKNSTTGQLSENFSDVSPQEVKAKMEKLVADSGGAATVGDVILDGDLYKVTILVDGKDQPIYVTKDGTKIIQNVTSFDEIEKQKSVANTNANQVKPQAVSTSKADKPTVDLFVMSYCPFGIQMEKGILPVIATLGDKIDYHLRFISYSMHGDKEMSENLRQYCIQKTQSEKLSTYLGCFLKKGEGTSDICLSSSGIDVAGIVACVAQTDSQFDIAKDATDKSTWSNGQYPAFNVDKEANDKYGVQGSPTLVINGIVDNVAGRDSASLLKSICSAFNTSPQECNTILSSDAPATGFGDVVAR